MAGTCGSEAFGAKKALKDVPLKAEVLKADTPTAKCLEVILTDGPSNSSFWTSSSTVFRALRARQRNHLKDVDNILSRTTRKTN